LKFTHNDIGQHWTNSSLHSAILL